MRDNPNLLQGMKNPPVVEIALAVQFATIPGYTPAHAGLFWKDFLDADWIDWRAVMPLEESFESFDANYSSPQINFGPIDFQAGRIQFYNSTTDRILQTQNNKLAYNWKQNKTDYPSFDEMCREFGSMLEAFQSFLLKNGLAELLKPNQWELIYVDHVPKGELWQSAADFHRVFPGLFPSYAGLPGLKLESRQAEQRFEIEPRRGRVYLSARHVMIAPGSEVIVLQSGARGGTSADIPSVLNGLKIGREAIRKAFVEVMSDEAHSSWKGN